MGRVGWPLLFAIAMGGAVSHALPREFVTRGQTETARIALRFNTGTPGAPPPAATRIDNLIVRCARLRGGRRCRRQVGEGSGLVSATDAGLVVDFLVAFRDGTACKFTGPSDLDFTTASGAFTCVPGRRRRACCQGSGTFRLAPESN